MPKGVSKKNNSARRSETMKKVWKRKGEKANLVAEELCISVAKVYKVWQGIQPSHSAYKSEFGKLPYENPEHYVEWLNS
jgi:hypothetical protein